MRRKSSALIVMFILSLSFIANMAVSPVAAVTITDISTDTGPPGTYVHLSATIDTPYGDWRICFDIDNNGSPFDPGEIRLTGSSTNVGTMSAGFIVPVCSGSPSGVAHTILLQDVSASTSANYTFYVTTDPEPPTAVIVFDPQSPEVDETVTFDATESSDPDGTISSYAWNFGDGSGSLVDIATATHAYKSAGTRTVTLTVTDNDGLKDTATQTITVVPPNLTDPVASFTFSPQSPEYGKPVTFDASGSSDSDGTISTYSWDFGDQTSGSDKTATHSYASVGSYTVTLTVTDNDGLTGTATKSIFVIATGVELTPPVASFTSSPASPEVGETVTFDATESSDSDGTITSYAWSFGDGKTITGQIATTAYASAGTYTVTLIVTDNDELTGTTTKDVVIGGGGGGEDTEAPVANAGSGKTVGVGSKVSFSGASSSDNVGVDSYVWDFGDGNSGTGETVSHTYSDVGNYTVSLTVADAAGNSNSVTILITVTEASGDAFPFWILIPILLAVIVAAFVIWFFFIKKRKPKEKVPAPSRIKLTADPASIMADGKSKSTITVELLDKEWKPVPAPAETKVNLTTSGGRLGSPTVIVAKGKTTGTTILTSSKSRGKIMLSADAEKLEKASISVEFVEKPRFCMGCGNRLTLMDRTCKKCGASASDFTGPAKMCKNCERNGKTTYLPATSEFCSECGASQPKETQ